ncbi:hypothetical protein SPB21_03945 [Leptothoe sp. ISB3NOV94-8A]
MAWRKQPITFAASAGDDLAITIDSVSDFRSSSNIAAEATKVTIRGYYGANTPGGGDFLIDRTDTTSTDNSGTVFVNTDGLRIKRSTSDEVLASWFGIRPDGVTDYSSQKNAIFEYALTNNLGIWFDQPGTYFFAGNDTATNANISHGQTFSVRGGPGVKIKLQGGSNYFIDFNSNAIAANLTADVNRGDRSIPTDDATIKNGDIIYLRLVNAANNSEIAWEQLFGVTLDANGTVYTQASKFFFPSADPYTLPDGTTELRTRVVIYKNTPNFIIKDFEFTFDLVGDNSSANFRRAIELHGGNVQLENLSLTTNRDATASEQGGFFNLPGIINWRHGRMTAKNIKAKNSGYTLWVQWCQSALIEDISGENIRHFITTNNAHDITVKNANVHNGGVLDAHGAWDYKAFNITVSNPAGGDLDNVRAQGNVEIFDSSFDIDELLLSAPVSAYTWDAWANTEANRQFFFENMLSNLSVKNTKVSGKIVAGTYKKVQSFSDCVCSGVSPGEMTLGSVVNIGATVEFDNAKDWSGNSLLLPVTPGNSRAVFPIVNKSNPQNEVATWVVDAADSANGNQTFIGLLEAYNVNVDSRYGWQFSRALNERIYGRQDTDPNTITIVLIVSWSGFPYVSPQQNRNIQLCPYGRLLHSNGGTATNMVYEDEANLIYTNSGATLINNFSQTRGSSDYQPLSITEVRSTQGNVGGGPLEPLPSEIGTYTNLHRIELDIDIDVRQANGSIAFGLRGTTLFYPIS